MIYHATYSYPPTLGGLEKVVRILATKQHESGHKISVITSKSRNHMELSDPFQVHRLRSFVFANTTFMPGLLLFMLRIRSDDVIHLHIVQAYMPEVVWLVSKLKGIRYIAHIHLDIVPSGRAGFLVSLYKKTLLKTVLRSAFKIIVFTDEQKNSIMKRYSIRSDNIAVIANGAEDAYFNSRKRIPHSPMRLLFVGRLNYQKNLGQLIKSLQGISHDFNTKIIGQGEDLKDLKTLVNTLGVHNVQFTGRLEGKKLLDAFDESDVFVLTSEREGMPLVLLEAMASGMPIIATDVTGSRDVVKDNYNGIIVPFNDPVELQKKLQFLKSDKYLYQKLNRNAVTESKQYSWTNIANKITATYGVIE